MSANDPMMKYQAAMDMIHALCTPKGLEGHRTWELSIPALADDPDIVISSALHALRDAWVQAKCRLKKAEARAELSELERSLAYEHTTSVIESECMLHETPDEPCWFDIGASVNPHARKGVDDAVRYLEARGLIVRHPEREWVQLLDESEATR